jgi:hypothetical protein
VTRVRVSVRLDPAIPIVEVEELWYDLTRWPAFMDGFDHVASVDADWPRDGTLIWDTHPGGRGRVVEQVTRYEVRASQTAEIEDPKITGTQTVSFGVGAVALELDYRLKDSAWLMDLLFVKRAQRDSLWRTLSRFRIELQTDRELRAATD